ncbi:hypothetical protein BS50DRAFT_682663 [Corynespora cassiicola Philippines]|uniref:Cation/H+ exchanger transmembrane domain-containing protein n=1 Tax=Corynespora cassiicola Philippines TaxID=1448308 RepID=A0A2T2N0D4_CORCC|nr:hypothetical protein BS50DRAFT_682663 [Corynespora cassiicola Philippines]
MAAGTSEDVPSLPYHEPGIVTILIQTSFLLLLNIINFALDRVLYCGLLGQVLVGITWGTPAAKLLSSNVEEAVVQLGYLGLILLSISGLHTSFRSLKANLLLSLGVAVTGIALPVGLSYTLQGLLHATPVQAFAAGAALCSTSLGTTFTVLGSSGLSATRLGVVLTSAAMMDDVVGLVMVQVISNLGGANFSWITVLRPVLVSVAFALFVPVLCILILKPATVRTNRFRESHPNNSLDKILRKAQTKFVLHTALLVGLVASATYAGTSNLFAAYIAGAIVNWWDSDVPHLALHQSSVTHEEGTEEPSNGTRASGNEANSAQPTPSNTGANNSAETQLAQASSGHEDTSGSAIYHRYYHPAVSKILQPLFFASIGFSIPITRMFGGAIVWRGIAYTTLMAIAKFGCGLWLVRIPISLETGKLNRLLGRLKMPPIPHFWSVSKNAIKTTKTSPDTARETPVSNPSTQEMLSSPNPPKPFSLHPPLILALAMCSRGEIGFLISGVAEFNGIFASPNDASADASDIFLVVTWAIVLCTIIGPLGVGLSVRRVKNLQEQRNKEQAGSEKDVLGVWGIE